MFYKIEAHLEDWKKDSHPFLIMWGPDGSKVEQCESVVRFLTILDKNKEKIDENTKLYFSFDDENLEDLDILYCARNIKLFVDSIKHAAVKKEEAYKPSFEWDMDPETWGRYKKLVDMGLSMNTDFLGRINGEYLGCARVGELCFDLIAHTDEETRENEICYLVFMGGVDDGYGYSAADALKTGKYKDKKEVPEKEMYPYTECGYGDLGVCAGMSFEMFKRKAEKEFDAFLASADGKVFEASKMPLHVY